MKKRYSLIVASIFLLAIVIGVCWPRDSKNLPNYTEEYRRIIEPYGNSFILDGNMFQTIVGAHTYEFESSISEEQRSAFVEKQEQLLGLLEEQNVSTEGLTFRVLENYTNRTESDSFVAYYGLETMKTWEQALTTIRLCMGDYTNYGYAYALANQIAGKLNWQQDSVTTGSVEIFSANPSLLNLVYPCFDEIYTRREEIIVCKALAVELLGNVADIWSEEDFLEARNSYAQDNDIPFEPTYLVFAYNGGSCPMKFRTKYMEVFRDSTFRGSNEFLDGLIEEDYMATVASMIHTFEWLDEHLTDYRSIFEVEESMLISVRLTENIAEHVPNQDEKVDGLFVSSADSAEIFATRVTSLAHEYVHFLFWFCKGTEDPAYENWYTETVANYYTLPALFENRLYHARKGDGASLEAIRSLIG